MSFARQVRAFAVKSEKALDQTVRAITFSLFREVVQRTPVGEPSRWKSPAPAGYVGGRLKGNWQVSIGSPAVGTLETIDATGTATVGKIAAGIGGFGTVTYLTNNLSYAMPIEYDGWSSIARQGMVRVSFARIDNIVAQAARANRV